MLLNCGVGEDSWEALGQQGDPTGSGSHWKSVLNIHWKDWCWSWKSNTLATWCEELTLEMTLMLGKIEGRKKRGQQRMRWMDGITDSMDMRLSKLQEIVKDKGSLACCSSWVLKESDITLGLNNSNKYKHNIINITVVFFISGLYRILYEYAYCYTSVLPD